MAIDAKMAVEAIAAMPQRPMASGEQRREIRESAEKFEAQLLSLLMQPMFQGLSTEAPFGGGNAEGTYRTFMMDAIGSQVAKSGGVGLAEPVMREMLAMQGLQ